LFLFAQNTANTNGSLYFLYQTSAKSIQFFSLKALSPITTFPFCFRIFARTFDVADSVSSPFPSHTITVFTFFWAIIPALKHFLFFAFIEEINAASICPFSNHSLIFAG